MTEACLPCNRRLSFELSFVSAMIMGSNTSKPYVVDEFDSNDDEGDSKSKLVSYNLVKCVPAKTGEKCDDDDNGDVDGDTDNNNDNDDDSSDDEKEKELLCYP